MPKIEIEVPDEEVARKIVGLVRSGRPARLVLSLRGRRVVGVEAQEEWLEPSPLGRALEVPVYLASGPVPSRVGENRVPGSQWRREERKEGI